MRTSKSIYWSFTLFIILVMTGNSASSQVGIGTTTPNNSSILELSSTDKGLLVPRLNGQQLAAITNPVEGLLIYLNDDGCFYYYHGISWLKITNHLNASDIWIDQQYNIIGRNSASQVLAGYNCISIGNNTFNDNNGNSSYLTAIGGGAASNDQTSGDAFVNVIGVNSGQNNSGKYLNAFGTGSAAGNSGLVVNAIGTYSAASNTGGWLNALGEYSAQNNTGGMVNCIGKYSASGNTGSSVNAFGEFSAYNNHGDHNNAIGAYALANPVTGTHINAIGHEAARYNSGAENVNAIGTQAAYNNSGITVNAFGFGSGYNNTHNFINILGNYTADAPQDEATILTGDLYLKDPSSSSGYTTGNKLNFQNGNVIESTAADVLQITDVMRLTPRSAAPSSPVKGMIYFDDTTNKLRVWDGTNWTNCN